MSDRTLFRILGTGALLCACYFAGRCGWAIAGREAETAILSALAAGFCAAGSVLLFAIEGSDDGID